MVYDVGPVASQVVGVAGMGISLGILAQTSRHVMDTMYGPRQTRGRPRKYKSSKRRPSNRQPLYNPYQPRYQWRF